MGFSLQNFAWHCNVPLYLSSYEYYLDCRQKDDMWKDIGTLYMEHFDDFEIAL